MYAISVKDCKHSKNYKQWRGQFPLKVCSVESGNLRVGCGLCARARVTDCTFISHVWERTSDLMTDGKLSSTGEKIMLTAIDCTRSNFLWCDWLCIDQENEVEVALEVSTMATYFSNAKHTLIVEKSDDMTIAEPLANVIESLHTWKRLWTLQEVRLANE